MRALIIDDEQLVLEGLDAFLRVSLPDISFDKTSDVSAALALAGTVHYGLVLLDWHLVADDGGHMDARRVIEGLREQGSMVPIIVVTGDDPAAWADRVFELGLSGYVPKSASGSTLVSAIRHVLCGGIYLPDRQLTERARAAAQRSPEMPEADTGDLRGRFPDLTDRQADVLRIMVRGCSDKQIARELDLSVTTVRTHVRAVLGVIGVSRRGEAVFKVIGRSRA